MANNESNWISDQVNKIINDVTSKAANQEGMFLPFPYAGIVQPKDYDGQTENGTDFEVANNAYQALKNKLISTPDMTSEAGTLKRAWSTPPKVTIDNGVLKLNGSDEFLKTSEAAELRKTLKEMEGNTYNTEKLNEQIEAWNATLAQMSEEYSSITDAMNRMNANLEQSAQNASHHQFTFQDMQKIGASASIGKREDARTTKDKIFVGFEYDDDGNVIERWVPAEEFFNEFNGLSDDQKRRAYRDLEIGATNGDVAAYSKLMYLQGGSQAGPANVDYDPAGDFWHVIGERVGQGLLGIGETVSNFVRPFNLGTITSNLVDYAGSEGRDFMDFAAAVIAPQLYADRYDVGGDSPQNITAEDFWSDKYSTTGGMSSWYRKAVEDYGAMVDWEVAYLSDMTPASTQAASNIGSVAGGVVDFVGSLYAMARGGQMGRKFNQLQVEKANQMFAGSKYFMPVGQIFIKNSGVKINQKGTPIVEGGKLTGWAAGETVAKGVAREIPYGGIYVPKVLMNISPKLTQFIEEVASSLTEVQFLRDAQNFINKDGTTILQFGRPSATGEIIYGAPKTFVDGKVIQGTKDYLAKLGGEGTAATNELSNIVNYSTTYELLKTLENKGTWRGISKGLQTAQSLATMFGFSAVRAADEYFQRVEAGEEIEDMASFVIAQTAKNAAFGAGLMGLGAGVKAKFFKNAAQNSNIPAVEYTREFYSKDFGGQKGWYSPTESTGVKVIGPGDDYLNKTEDIQTTLSTIMTVNAEGIVGFPTEEGASVAPIVGSSAISQDDLGRTFGVASSTKVTKLSLKPTAGGAYIVEETTDLATNTKTEVRRFKNNIEEAQQEIKEKSVPKTTARTIANSDQVQGVKVAPLTINGTAPSVMPNGVTQIKVEPGVVYRTPDGIVDELAEMAANDKWHETNIDRFYRDYEKYSEEYQKGGVEFTNENIPVIYKNENGEVDFRNDSFWRVSGAAFRMPLGTYDSFAKKVYDNYKKIDKQINAKLSDVDRSHTELGDSESYREQTLKAYAENKAPEVPDKLLDSDWYVKNKMLQASLVDSSPRVTFDKFQADTLGAVRRELREKGYDNLSPEMKARVDMVDSYFSQTQTNDMVLYRGETLTDYAKNLQPGDKIDSSSWSFMSPSRGYTKMYRMGETTADRSRAKGGVLYRYHTKAGQPIFYSPDATFDYDANNEMVLPRGINATVTSVKDNKLGEVFGELTPQKIVDVEVEVSGVATGDKVQWGDGASVIDEIYRRNGGAVSPVSPEAFDLPTELYGTDIDGILRLAAWSKANGYGAIPFKTPVAQTHTIKKFSMQDKFISKLADKYNLPEIDVASIIRNSRGEQNDEYYGTTPNGTLQYVLGAQAPEINTKNIEAFMTPEQVATIDIYGALSILLDGDIYNYLQLTNTIEQNRKATLHDAGSKAVRNENSYRGNQINHWLWGMGKKEMLEMVDRFAEKIDKVDGLWPDDARREKAVESARTTLRDAIEKGYDYFVDLCAPADESLVPEFAQKAFDVNEGMAKAAANGTPLNSDIVVPVTRVGDNIVYSELDKYEERGDDKIIAHIPAGTKVAKKESYDSASGQFKRTPNGGRFFDWMFDTASGITEKDGELYVNKPGGSQHTPDKFEYNLSDYGVYDMMRTEGMEAAANDLLELNEEISELNKRQRDRKADNKRSKTIYEVTEPGGPVNRINHLLRQQEVVGTIPEDSVAQRAKLARELIDRATQEGNGYDEYGWWSTEPSYMWSERVEELINSLESVLLGHGARGSRDTLDQGSNILLEGSKLSGRLQKRADAIRVREYINAVAESDKKMPDGWIEKALETRGLTEDDIAPQPDNIKVIDEYIADVRKIFDELVKYQMDYDEPPANWDNRMVQDELVEKLHSMVDDLVSTYSDKSVFKDGGYSVYMEPLLDGAGEAGAYKVKANMLWDIRGIAEGGNSVNSDEGIKMRVQSLEPGDHVIYPSMDYGSFNLGTPNRYARGGDYDAHQYYILTGSPKGTGVFFYGDPENFGGYDSDMHIHTRDGGAIVHPMNMGATIVSVRELGPNATLIIQIRDNADGTPYNGPIDGQNGGVEKITERVRTDEVVSEPNNFLVTQYGVPYGWFSHPGQALQYASEIGERRTYEVSPDEATLERPPVTTDEIKLLMPVEPLEKLSAGGYPTEQLQRFNDLMATMPTLESPEDYTRGIIDIVHQVQQIYNQVAMNINIASLYENYGRALAEGRKPQAMLYEQEALRPLTQVLDALGHYFDPSGKSLTQEFYLPTALKPDKKISIIDAIMGRDGVIDEESPVDGGLSEILLDPLRVGDAGFWQKRTGDLFRDANGNFTMAKSGTLEDALIAYTVSALTRGKNKLYVAAQNEVARSKFDKNRSQITSKQAMAMLKDADTLRTKTKTIQANAVKDAEAIADLKNNYSGDESAIDEAIKAKNYADELNYTNSLNTIAQKGGYNQNLQMSPIAGSAARFGTDAGLRGISNIRRKMSRINVTGTMYVYRPGSGKVNIGFGLEAGDPNFNIYGHFYPEKAVNLGDIVNKHYDSDMAANLLYERIRDKVTEWTGQSWALKEELDDFVLRSFPLAENFEWWTARAEKIIARAYNSYGDSEEKFRGAVVKELSAWIRRGTLDTFNNAIMMSNISNLDTRTINALDEAAAYMLVGTPVKRAAIADFAQWLAVTSKLSGNFGPTIGNSIFEPTRIIEQFGIKIFLEAWGDMMDPRKIAEAKRVMSELPSRFTGDEAKVGLAKKAKNLMGNFVDKATELSLFPTEWSEAGKNLLFYFAAKRNAELMYPGDEMAQLDSIINNINDSAIAGGRGTTPGIATGSLGQTLNIFKTFTWRNIDDFIERIEQQSRGEGDSYKWKKAYEKHNSGRKDKAGRNKFDPRIAARLIGGRLARSYLLWLFIGAYFGKSYMDVLGGDPTGITDDRDRGLYDDPETDANEGMTPLDYIINKLPGGPIFSVLQDYWFALRRRGVENGGFLAGDIDKDQKFMDNLGKNLPLGVAKNRFSDMLSLLDRGYSFTSTGRKTYAAPDTALDAIKGFLFGKSTTANSIAYGKYRYGMVDIWGDLSSGDWMDFAMNANPLSGIMGSQATFDTTRKDYTGVFNGSWNDISTMQLIVQQFRERQQKIIDDYQRDKYRYTGDFAGLTDEEKTAKAKENRDKAIDEFTNDVVRAVDEFEKAGNALNDNQITNLMYLFDFHEGEEDDEWNSSAARQRYVEAGLPDYNAGEIKRVEKTEDGNTTEETQGILERSLVLKNAEQGYYGAPKAAANALKDALKDFKGVYKDYSSRVKDLNSQYFAARNKNKKSNETKRLSQQVEDLQNEYLDKLYAQISPVVEQYGTALVGTYDSADVLQEYMGNMIPYSSIKEYGQTYSNGNDIVYGQLTEWLQKRWGRSAPTAPSDREVTDAISNIRRLLDQGKKSQAKDRARATLERIGRGSLGARREDVETLRGYLYD